MKNCLIILTGWAVGKFVWKPLCELLKQDYNITFIDWEDVTSADGFEDKVKALIREKGIERFSIIGWSLGSLVAIDIAANFLPQIDRMILFSATSRFIQDETGDYKIGWNRKIIDRMIFSLKKRSVEILDSFYKNLFTSSEVSSGYYEYFLKEMQHINKNYPVQYLYAGLEYLIMKDLRENLGSVDIPTLLIHGGDDRICPVEAGAYVNSCLKTSEMVVLAETGHAPFFTKTNQCWEVIKNHMANRGEKYD